MSQPFVTTADMVALLSAMLAPEHAERLRGARLAAKNGAPPCECGACVICLWQFVENVDGTLRDSAERAAGENHNFRQTLANLRLIGREALKRHTISLTTTKDGVTTPLTEPDLDHIIRGLDKYAQHAAEVVKRAEQVEADSKAAVRGYHESTKNAVEERDRLEKTARGLSAQYEACLALAAEALHYAGEPPKDTKLTTLIGKLASQRDTALSREIALRLFIEGHTDYVTGPDMDAVEVEVAGTVLRGRQLKNVVLTAVQKISAAWALPGSPSVRMIQDSRLAKQIADEARAAVAWIPTLQLVPSTELQGKTAVGALRHVIEWLMNRLQIDPRGLPGTPPRLTEAELSAFPPVETPVKVEGTIQATLASLQSRAKANVGPVAPGVPIPEDLP